MARFRGKHKTEFLDNRQFHGNAFDLLLKAERFLRGQRDSQRPGFKVADGRIVIFDMKGTGPFDGAVAVGHVPESDAAGLRFTLHLLHHLNLRHNRLLADLKLPVADRVTWTTPQAGNFRRNSELVPSGLLQPATITLFPQSSL